MTGVLAAAAGCGDGAGSGETTPTTPIWTAIFGRSPAGGNVVQMTGLGTTISVSASLTGGAYLFYIQNGAITDYAGPFTVSNDDYLGWIVAAPAGEDKSGTVTVTNATTSTTMATFNYILESGF